MYVYVYETDQIRALNVQRKKFCDENSLSFSQFSPCTFCDSTRSLCSANMQIRDRGTTLRDQRHLSDMHTARNSPFIPVACGGLGIPPLPLFTTKKIEFDS
ncbi:hypothetical protein CEXT_227601 [Caerostris extrusa]|uniref:Uncharacterized protein n=1 Tax=Caerostris extrusa TaxID=172846 RepID=A0AAV4QZE5_CAEEX|nr:hypothetical protein CEXT_227601 [Caerostris extrusa]